MAERLLWKYIKNGQLNGVKFRRQFSINAFVLDFYCPEHKIAIEIDGPTHDSLEAQAADKHRQHYIEKFDIQFLRFTNNEIFYDLDHVLETIKKLI